MTLRRVLLGGGGGGGPGLADAFSLGITLTDASSAPTDLDTYLIAFAQSDTNDVQSETVELAFPAPDFADTSNAPTDTKTFTMLIWLSGGTATANGVTNVGNSDGANNAAVATIASAVAGVTNPKITSALGANVPSGVAISSAIYRGWFKSVNVLVTSTGSLVMHSTSALFADKTMLSNAALNTTVDRLAGDFTYDLIANGIDTLARLQSCQMIHQTVDAAAGVQPHTLTVDAGCIELAGAFT